MSDMHSFLLLLGLTALASAVPTSSFHYNNHTRHSNSSCKVIPGDAGWPSIHQWSRLNDSLSGRLIASVPLASVCHDAPFNNFDAASCLNLQNTWDEADQTHIDVPVEVLSQTFQNYSCVPYTPQSQACELGNYASYVVNVSDASHVQTAIAFAHRHNVRIVIKNTGHDYLGKSTGTGALTLWTHNLQTIDYMPSYNRSSSYTGAAARLGAGVQGYETLLLGNETNTRIVGGTCPTVGVAGGYSLGGGHSLLSSSYGTGADNILELDVVTANGTHLTASPEENADLYWALAGGGGGVFGVVLSMTVRLHPGGIVGGTILSFNDSAVGQDEYWAAVGAFNALLPDFLDSGHSFTYQVGASEFIAFGTMPDADEDEVNKLLKPFLDDLISRGITPQNFPFIAPDYYTHFYDFLGPAPFGNCSFYPFTNSRIIPRDLITHPDTNANVTSLFRTIATDEDLAPFAPFYCDSFSTANASRFNNSQPEAWRSGMLLCAPAAQWDWSASPSEMAALDRLAAYTLQPMMDAATPGGLTYLNEANHLYRDWKTEMYAESYDGLLSVKQAYDEHSFLYAKSGVGSDAWQEDADGRLCRVSH